MSLPFKSSTGSSDRPSTESDKNFGLSRNEFEQMVRDMRSGDDRLFERIYLAEFTYCQDKLMHFDRLDEQAAYDATMEGLLHFRDLLLREKIGYGNLRFLFVKITRQVYRRNNKQVATTQELTIVEMNTVAEDNEYELSENQFETMGRAFAQLGPSCKELLKSIFFNHQGLRAIAAEEGIAYPAIRKRKSRCVERLRSRLSSL